MEQLQRPHRQPVCCCSSPRAKARGSSFAFIAGVVPLALSTGAGAGMRQAMGIAVLASMLGVTLFGLFLTPVFYALLSRRQSAQQSVSPAVVEVSGHAS
jgi:hypothetical protein